MFYTTVSCVWQQIWLLGSPVSLQGSRDTCQHRRARKRQTWAHPRRQCRLQGRPRHTRRPPSLTADQLPAAHRWSEPAAQVAPTTRLSWCRWWPEMRTARRLQRLLLSAFRCTGLMGGSDEPAATATKYALHSIHALSLTDRVDYNQLTFYNVCSPHFYRSTPFLAREEHYTQWHDIGKTVCRPSTFSKQEKYNNPKNPFKHDRRKTCEHQFEPF